MTLERPAKAELIRPAGAAVQHLRDAMALRCQRLTQQLTVVKAATACDDDLHGASLLARSATNRKKQCSSEVFFLRAVCCSVTQGWLGFPWPPKRGWAKTCATLPWPIRGWALQFLVFRLTRRSPREGSGCQGGDPAELGSAPRGP